MSNLIGNPYDVFFPCHSSYVKQDANKTFATQINVLFHHYISVNNSVDISKFGVPDLPTRTIQAWLYEDAMKRTLTVEEMKVFEEYLDTDIKIVVSNSCRNDCLWKAFKFESNFYDCRNQVTSETSKINRFVQLIKMGQCTCEACREAIEKGIEKETRVCGLSLLHCLMMSDSNLYLIAFLNDIGCDMKRRTILSGHYPLTLAMKDKQTEIVKYFVKHFDKHDFKPCFQMALRHAVMKEEPCEEIIEALLSARWIDADYFFKVDEERLLMKVLKKHGQDWYKVLRALLKGGADPNKPDSKGFLPLLHCISKNSTKLVQLFIEFGANVNTYGKRIFVSKEESEEFHEDRTTPLLAGVLDDQFDICRLLLVNGADPNRNLFPTNHSPISYAVMNGSVALVKLLIRHGADLASTRDDGFTVVHDAVDAGHLEILNTLLYADAPHDIPDEVGNTPLMLTTLPRNNRNDISIMKALLAHEPRCEVNKANQFKDTALHVAASMNLPDKVALLIKYGADPNLCNGANATPLWNAVFEGATEVVRKLLLANVEMEVMSQGRYPLEHLCDEGLYPESRSTLYVALENGHTDIVLLLKAAGYDIRKETWIQSDPIPNEDLYAPFIVDWIVSSKSPDRLENLCKSMLRKNLASEPGHDIYKKVEKLDIPQLLKDCLLLRNIQ